MDDLEKRYFDWLVETISTPDHKEQHYMKLLHYLHSRSFNYILPMDGNRSEDGIDLRYSGFAWQCGIDYHDIARYLDTRDCSILEMMVALSIRGEDIVSDPNIGDRTSQWFWKMISNLGLEIMSDEQYDESYVAWKIDCFVNRDYKIDGKGGLFIVEDPPYDMRLAEIWNQMCWYLNENA